MPEERPGEEAPVRMAGTGAGGCGVGAEGHGDGVVPQVVCDGGEHGAGGRIPGAAAVGGHGVCEELSARQVEAFIVLERELERERAAARG